MTKQGFFARIYNRLTGNNQPGGRRWFMPAARTAGIYVDEENALTYSAIWRAVNLISASIAIMPWSVNQKTATGIRSQLLTHPAATLLDVQPNPETDALTFRQTMIAWALTYGNGYAEIERDRSNRPIALWHIHPSRVKPARDDSGGLVWVVTNGMNPASTIKAPDMFHLKGLGYDGVLGYSVIAHAAKTIGLGLATEEFGSNFFANGANAGGVLQHPGVLGDEALKHLKESLVDSTGGRNSRAPMILEEGMQWETISIPPDDAQFLETRKFGIAEVARWYGVPLHKLHEMDKSSFNNIEQQNIEFVTDALLPWVRRLEIEANIKLVSSANRGRVFTKLNMNALLRGDTAARGAWYKMMTNIGAMSINEVRDKEDENPIGDDGDKYMVQMNLTTIDKVGQDNAQQNPQNPLPAAPDGEQGEPPANPAARAILAESAGRIIARLQHRAAEALKNYDGDRAGLVRYLAKFAEDQQAYMQKQLEVPVRAFGMNVDLNQYIRQQLDDQAGAILASFDSGEAVFHVEQSVMVDKLFEAAR